MHAWAARIGVRMIFIQIRNSRFSNVFEFSCPQITSIQNHSNIRKIIEQAKGCRAALLTYEDTPRIPPLRYVEETTWISDISSTQWLAVARRRGNQRCLLSGREIRTRNLLWVARDSRDLLQRRYTRPSITIICPGSGASDNLVSSFFSNPG